ncbi:uncharacterized protein F5147DRAFT_779705 [Suillus discolor]|uniref:Uncharacterized protein n=1 Tax=Suillus discolor TaxID=1912936 RepID=A0A9P7EV17_9AGAM|nr:uncharacterized protein F5147DRAFT_779705 [Suillus discolor]KAG2092310.1 hypothetical protein F5147DRAFT_779705 [Suillus discolor]
MEGKLNSHVVRFLSLESIVPVHPTDVRRPNSITVQSENTVYTDNHITAKYLNRGADVVVSDGQFTILPTVKPYEFQTTRKVGKTGLHSLRDHHRKQAPDVLEHQGGNQQPNYIGSVLHASPAENQLDRVVVFWTANTECYSDIIPGVNDTPDNVLATIKTILTELLTRVKYRGEGQTDFAPLHAVLSLLSYMFKAPLVKPGTDVVNSLGRQPTFSWRLASGKCPQFFFAIIEQYAWFQLGVTVGPELSPNNSTLTPTPSPDAGGTGQSEAFDAFLCSSLVELTQELEHEIHAHILPSLQSLKPSSVAPLKLLSALHTLHPLHMHLLHLPITWLAETTELKVAALTVDPKSDRLQLFKPFTPFDGKTFVSTLPLIEPRYLGGRSFARIHGMNLKKQGMLGLTFAKGLYDKICWY